MANNDVSIKPNLQQTLLQSKSTKSPAVAQAESFNKTESVPKPIVEQMLEQQEAKKELAQASSEALQEKVAQLNDHMQNLQRQLRFQVDDQSGDTIVQVIDSETDKLVRQIPSQEVLDVRDAIERYKGILLKEKA
jgi:flagellar protein FlaG